MAECGKTAEGGWSCAGTGCLAGGSLCMLLAADPAQAAPRPFSLRDVVVLQSDLDVIPADPRAVLLSRQRAARPPLTGTA